MGYSGNHPTPHLGTQWESKVKGLLRKIFLHKADPIPQAHRASERGARKAPSYMNTPTIPLEERFLLRVICQEP